MLYELMVLSLLMQSPFHAYLIAKIFNEAMGPWEQISKGSLSMLLNKLKKNGMIEVADPTEVPYPTDSRSRVFKITPLGRKRFHQLMMDTTTNLGAYQKIFRIKSLHLEFLTLKEQLYLVDHYIYYCRAAIHHLQKEIQGFDHTDSHKLSGSQFYKQVRKLLSHQIEQWQHEIAWTEELHKEILREHKEC